MHTSLAELPSNSDTTRDGVGQFLVNLILKRNEEHYRRRTIQTTLNQDWIVNVGA